MSTGYSYSIKGGPAPSRPPRDFVDSQFETAPPVQEPPPRNPKRNLARNLESGPPTLAHSQPRAIANVYTASRALHRQQDAMETISPPSSPEPAYARRAGQQIQGGQRDRDVSPIDDDRRGTAQQPRSSSRNGGDAQQSRTNIPMMRRARRKQSDAALREAQARERQASNPSSAAQQRGEVRWDAMTGEPTASAAGRPPQVRPAEYAQGLGISTGSSPPQRSPSAMMTAFGAKVRRMRHSSKGDKKPEMIENDTDPAANAFASSRPGWRGASGRTAIVEPVRDNLQVAPLRIAPKDPKRVASPTSATSPTSNQAMGRSVRGQTPPVSPPGTETAAGSRSRETIRKIVPSSQVATPAESKHQSGGPSYPSPPLSGSFDRSDAPSVAAKQLQSSITGENNLRVPNAGSQQPNESTMHRKPHPAHAHQESVSSVYSQASHAPAPPAHSANRNTLAPGDPWVQPASRFSITTYATSAANTPRESLDDFVHNRPPVPDTPLQYRDSPQPQQDSITDRRDHYMSSPFQTPPSAAAQQRQAAAPAGFTHPALTAMRVAARTTADRPDSIASSINKSLPPAPPETSAGETRDRVAMINAQLQGLGNRRINILRSIKQMTELMPTDSMLDSADVVHKRELEKRKVEALKQELAEVRREEYELGLKLHRAYKRMDRDDNFEPTTLWVRRVTG
ncbi:hypothetical protein CONLIGDRAFT_678161 [Coniochaeta ligniaria NRRL 30616]|uniref:Uncharacterized protein n=1 Tax=Coniochaeta ligniaria NRRL 30616 TaxID=1408157 RepID=A0A1J7JEE0_9PEZI|nr:hypothetical protein CONLIGDRAFT_678161 [Coniochaeta ligniaria NRRL 30616]